MFNLSKPFILRPIGTILLALGLFLIGMVARLDLPVAPLPNLESPTISVSASQSGASPTTMAATVAAPLEKQLGQIAGVNEITSRSSMGSTNVTLQFDLAKDINKAARDVSAAINTAAADLPVGLPNPPTYRKANPNNQPVMVLALSSKATSLAQLYNYADSLLAQRIAQTDGVAQVDVVGSAQPAVRIQVNSRALAAMGFKLRDVRSAVTSLNANAPKGSLSDGGRSFAIAANDQLATALDFNNTIIGMREGRVVQLSAVGQAINASQNPYAAAWFNHDRAVLLMIRKQADANVIETVDRIKALLPMLRSWMPADVSLDVQTDRTNTIRESVRDVQLSLLISVALVIMVMLLFLRRLVPTLIAAVTVPLSLAGTFIVMWFCGYSLNNFSLMALTVAVGFVVDDAIVVIENIMRHIERGERPLAAAMRGGREIGFTVLSMSISLVAVFIPIMFMGDVIGKLFREFAVTLSVAIAVSGVVSLTLTPSLCGRYLRGREESKREPLVFRWFEAGYERFQTGYGHALRWSLRHSWVMLLLTVAAAGATVYLYATLPKGFFPRQDTGLLQGGSRAAQSISFEDMAQKQEQVRDIILKDPDVISIGSSIGGRTAPNSGDMSITLRTRREGRKSSSQEVIDRLRPELAKITGLNVFLSPAQDMRIGGRAGSEGSSYGFAMKSNDIQTLYDFVPKMVDYMSTLPGIVDINSDLERASMQMNVVVDRDTASRLGVGPSDVDNALSDAFGQSQILTTYTELNQYKVILEASPLEQRDPTTLERIRIQTPGGNIALAGIARFERGMVPLTVNHDGLFSVVNINFNLEGETSLSDATALVSKALADLRAPPEIFGSFTGNAGAFQKSTKTLPLLILTAILAVYIVLGMLYENLIHPLTILSTLPTAGLGALLAMMVFKTELSLVSVIGIILLIGIVKKNAIMMVDFALAAERDDGLTPREAIYQACMIRLRPIMMTTMAALLGAVPLAVGIGEGAELRQPLGIAVVGGLFLSQALTLFTTPVIYLSLDWVAQKFGRRKPRLLPQTTG